jgi:hypothetical protein
VSAPTTTPSKRRRSRRWLRLAVPFGLLIAFWAASLVFHSIEEPNLADSGTLSPTGTGRHGSSQLAERLQGQGVTIERVTSSQAALQSAAESDSTVFVPTPGFLDPRFFERVMTVAGSHRVVVVRPSLLTSIYANLPVASFASRWATLPVAASCAEPYAARAPRAAVYHDRFDTDPDQHLTSCYGGGLAALHAGDDEYVYVGASDPFRNDRIDEFDNSALVTGLLGEHRHVIWIDVHAREFGANISVPPLQLPRYRRGDRDRSDTGFPVIDAFPPWLWAGLVLALVGAILLAIARARRLGPPVAEPLPVLVPAAEAVTGRGRLYERIHARQATLDALRAAAMTRIARVLDPFGRPGSEREYLNRGTASDAFVGQIAQRTGWSADAVAATLYGTRELDDAGLAAAVAEVDALLDAVLHNHSPQPNQGGTP